MLAPSLGAIPLHHTLAWSDTTATQWHGLATQRLARQNGAIFQAHFERSFLHGSRRPWQLRSESAFPMRERAGEDRRFARQNPERHRLLRSRFRHSLIADRLHLFLTKQSSSTPNAEKIWE